MAWENKETKYGIRYSRYIASWYNACRSIDKPVTYFGNFEKWLRSMKLEEEDIENIVQMAQCGKHELENSARASMLGYVPFMPDKFELFDNNGEPVELTTKKRGILSKFRR